MDVKMTVRELKDGDLDNGFLTTLDSLRPTSDIDRNKAAAILEKIRSNPDQVIVVAEVKDKIVGAATLLLEQKFIHNGGVAGHIEDVVVDKDFQGSGIGAKIITYLLDFARKKECYKVILDCTKEVRPFYEKLGFTYVADELRFDPV